VSMEAQGQWGGRAGGRRLDAVATNGHENARCGKNECDDQRSLHLVPKLVSDFFGESSLSVLDCQIHVAHGFFATFPGVRCLVLVKSDPMVGLAH